MLEPTLTLLNLELSYENKKVFTDISLDLFPGEWVGLLGPSGVGKTSLLRLIVGLSTPQEKISGQVKSSSANPLCNQIAFMTQQDLLLPWLSALDNVLLRFRCRPHTTRRMQELRTKAITLLAAVGIESADFSLYPHQLSGGMRQRIALVRTLLEEKPIILMDEPFSALDAITRFKLQRLAKCLLRQQTILFITHDPQEALCLADRIFIMSGEPASLQLFKALHSPTPRALDDTEVMHLQAPLYAMLESVSQRC